MKKISLKSDINKNITSIWKLKSSMFFPMLHSLSWILSVTNQMQSVDGLIFLHKKLTLGKTIS